MEAESESASIEKVNIPPQGGPLHSDRMYFSGISNAERVWRMAGRDGRVGTQQSRWTPSDTGSEKYDCDVVVVDVSEDVRPSNAHSSFANVLSTAINNTLVLIAMGLGRVVYGRSRAGSLVMRRCGLGISWCLWQFGAMHASRYAVAIDSRCLKRTGQTKRCILKCVITFIIQYIQNVHVLMYIVIVGMKTCNLFEAILCK